MILREIFRHLAASLILFTAVVAIATTRADVDLWGHVLFGLDSLRNVRLEAADPYSFTSDRPWVNHEWLSEVILALAWRYGGSAGLVAIKLACTLGALALVSWSLRASGVGMHNQVPLLGLAAAGMLPRVNHVRPQLFSVLLYAGLLLAFTKSAQGRRWPLLWCIPILTLWANVHGGWIVGLATVGIWTAGLAIEERPFGARSLAVLGFAAAAVPATLINPYGVELWAFLLETVRFGREAIEEWGPIWTYPHLLLLWSVFTAMLAGALWTGRVPLLSARALVAIAWCLASVRVSRLDTFFALSVIVLIGPGVAGFFSSARSTAHAPFKLGIVGAVTLVLLLATPARNVFTCVTVYSPWWPEPESVAYVQANALAGNMVTFFRWGEYGIWHLPRSIKVSMDGRRETVYSDSTVSSHIQLYRGSPEGLAYLNTLNADYVWFPRQLSVTGVLEEQGWIPIFRGPQSVLLARRDSVRGVPQASNGGEMRPADRCFPGP